MENNDNKFPKIIFITGGTKSGKSEFAEHLGRKIKEIKSNTINQLYIQIFQRRIAM